MKFVETQSVGESKQMQQEGSSPVLFIKCLTHLFLPLPT